MRRLFLSLAFAAAGLSVASLAGGWPSTPAFNSPAALAPNLQHLVASAPDGEGGVFLAWEDARKDPGAIYPDIYAQHLDRTGLPAIGWPTTGVAVCTTAVQSLSPSIVADGNGGAIIAYFSARHAPSAGIYAQRIDRFGVPQWSTNGVLVSGAGGNVSGGAAISSDGQGGAFLAWDDSRLAPGFREDVFAQHLSADGTMLWLSSGVQISGVPGFANDPGIAPDGVGGAFIAWSDNRLNQSLLSVYAQRVSQSGLPLWAADGVLVSTTTANHTTIGPRNVAADGAGGVYVGWVDNYAGSTQKAYVQHLTSSGSASPGWPDYGVPLSFDPSPSYAQAVPLLTPDGIGGVELTFRDSRNFGYAIRAQRVDFAGNILWGASGVSVYGTGGGTYHATVPDSAGGFIIGTTDPDGPIVAQRLDANGVPQWSSTGVILSNVVSVKRDITGVPDGAHGAIFAWTDDRNESSAGYYGGDIYAQNVNADGSLGGTIVATELALTSAEATPDRITLRWFDPARRTPSARLERSDDGWIWSSVAVLTADGNGSFVYEDRDVIAGRRYAYRLAVREGVGESFTSVTWIAVPAELELAFDGPWPQPSGRDFSFRITLATNAHARLRLVDLQGRVIATLIDGLLPAGQHTRRWGLSELDPPLASGVYFARLEVAGRTLTRRIAIAR